MKTIGITAEYNPFHTGHAYQIAQSRQIIGGDTAILAVMSGNWIQQADCAIADKWVRAGLAVRGGADLVLELPTPWATASAESFCRGAVSLMEASGVVDILSFGSECGSIEDLSCAAEALDSPDFPILLSGCLDRGMSFPAARQEAVRLLGCGQAELLSGANNNLGVEYLRALHALGSSISPITVSRKGAGHNTISRQAGIPFVSATQIRQAVRSGNWSAVSPYLIPGAEALLKEGSGISSISCAERAMLARLRTMSARDWSLLPDSGAAEGLPRRLERAARQARSLEEFYTLSKTKRYTHARIRRLALRAFLDIPGDLPALPPYLRVLAFNARGQTLIRQMKKSASLPIITKPAHAKALPESAGRLFELEAKCTDLYDLCLEQIPVPGREWTTNPVMLSEVP